MSKRLEAYIKDHREEFDEIEPSADLWARIEKHLPPTMAKPKKREAKTFSLGFVLRLAATVVFVMGLGFAVYLRNTKKEGVDLASIDPVYARQQVQYASLIESKRSELKGISNYDPELYKEFNAEITEMENTYKELNKDLATSPDQERVLRAMIRNLKIQTAVLNQQLSVIGQLKKMKNEQKNDTKAI